jgi:GxxExxY protein
MITNAEDAKGAKRFMETKENILSNQIIGGAIEVHRQLGPGLLESVYEECLSYELNRLGVKFERQKGIPVLYKEINLDCSFRVDLLVDGLVVVELKTVEKILPIHEAQLFTYLRLTGCKLGLMLNFYVVRLKDGIKRVVMNL